MPSRYAAVFLSLTVTLGACTDAECSSGQVYAGDFLSLGDEPFDDVRCAEVITGDLQLTGLSGEAMPELRHVLGHVRLRNSDVDMPNLRLVGGDLEVSGGRADVLGNLPALETVEGDFSIELSGVENLEGLEALQRVEGTLRLSSLENFASVKGLESLRLGGLKLSGLGKLESIEFDAEHIEGRVFISGNDTLKRVKMVGSAGSLSDALRQRADGPVELSACEGILNSTLVVFNNPKLERFAFAFRFWESVEFTDNPKLATIENLDLRPGVRLECLQLDLLPALDRATLSNHILSISRHARISRTGLSKLSDLGDLISVGCALEVWGNDELRTLDDVGLDIGTAGDFHDNPRLPQCQVDALAEDWMPRMHEDSRCYRYGDEVKGWGNDEEAVCI